MLERFCGLFYPAKFKIGFQRFHQFRNGGLTIADSDERLCPIGLMDVDCLQAISEIFLRSLWVFSCAGFAKFLAIDIKSAPVCQAARKDSAVAPRALRLVLDGDGWVLA